MSWLIIIYSRAGVAANPNLGHKVTLLADLDRFLQQWNLKEREPAHLSSDVLLDATLTEEAREKAFCDLPMTHAAIVDTDNPARSDIDLFAEAALKVSFNWSFGDFLRTDTAKMVLGTPDDRFEPTVAANMLHKIGDSQVESAMDRLLADNVLSKLIRDPSRMIPGRSVKISDLCVSELLFIGFPC